jgi:hypothetical protein
MKKINIIEKEFSHHRNGWNPISKKIKETFHCSYGINFYAFLDFKFKENTVINHPWTGILHNVISYPINHPKYNQDRIWPLDKLIKEKFFLNSLSKCHGIFTLSENTLNFLKPLFNNVYSLKHPIESHSKSFCLNEFKKNKKIITVGQWLRKYDTISKIKSNIEKIVIKIPGEEYFDDSSITFINFLPNKQYDNLIASSVVLVDYFDVSASNTVLECIARNTPLLTNPLPGNIEYLGKDYPFFFENEDEMNKKLNDEQLIAETNCYLSKLDKTKLKIDYFIESIRQSEIYKNIKLKKIF